MRTVFDFFYLNYVPRKVKKEGRKHYVTLLGCLVSSFRDNSEFPNISFLKCPPPQGSNYKSACSSIHSSVIYMP